MCIQVRKVFCLKGNGLGAKNRRQTVLCKLFFLAVY